MNSSVKKISLTALITALFLFTSNSTHAQCLEIESILVDACGLGSLEGENEMIRFKVGSTPLNSSNLTASFPTANTFLGICQNGASANATANLNATIIGCGFLKEPTAGILPANANVLLLTSTDIDITANSFANLNDTLYVIYQCAGNTSGHFGNNSAGIKTFSISFSIPVGCTDVVSWQNSNLIGGNGALVNFDPPGNATFSNNGCQAAFVPSGISASVLLGSSLQICPGDSINLFGTLIGNIDSLKWSGGLGTFNDSENDTATYYSSINETDSFYIKIRGFNACVSGITDSVLVYFVDSSDVSILEGTSIDICPGTNTNLNASGASNYLWSTSSISNSISINSAAQFFVTDTTNKCFPDTAFIQVNLSTQPSVTISENDTSICQGETVILHANGANNYVWNNSSDSITVITSGSYFVYSTIPCLSDTDTVLVTVVQPTNVTILESNPSFLCNGTSFVLHASPSSNNYTWNTSENSDSITINTSGTYTVNFSDNICPNTSASIDIIDQSFPSATIIGESSFCFGESLFLDALGIGDFTWSNGDSGNSTLINSPQQIILTATNFCGTATDTKRISERNCNENDSVYVFIPNVITPNNDNSNDIFKIEGIGIKSFSGKIYNRWGKLLFEWNDINTGWNGNENSEGTYFFVVEISFINDENEFYKGSVELFK
ncbi:MAG: gliding motility-associated C-terminal domain-containing protein [Vicingaceae bacterium]|nr:gliding motility-associated C-terminal domain-containing protein [Vicingaceae bacterium]